MNSLANICKPRVVIESPYAGDSERNIAYAKACLHDSLKRGEAPIASHLLYTQPGVLDDALSHERQLGMEAGWSWIRASNTVAVYCDYGISDGMLRGIKIAELLGVPIDYRLLESD